MMQSLQENKANTAKLSRVLLLVTLDILVCNVVAFLALWIRHEFSLQVCIDSGFLDTYVRWAIPNTLAVLALFAAFKLYMTLWSFAGAEEMARIFVASVTMGILQMLLVLLKLAELPRSFPVLFAMMLFIATVIVRFSYRFIRRLRLHLPSYRPWSAGMMHSVCRGSVPRTYRVLPSFRRRWSHPHRKRRSGSWFLPG